MVPLGARHGDGAKLVNLMLMDSDTDVAVVQEKPAKKEKAPKAAKAPKAKKASSKSSTSDSESSDK